MKILILGGDGMLGHQLYISMRQRHEIRVTLRQNEEAYQHYSLFTSDNSYFDMDVRSNEALHRVFLDFQPQAVINAVGIVKQRKSAEEVIPSLEINALFPHRLATLCASVNSRLIHYSTDCVFSGKKGRYHETDNSDAYDLYGKSKYLGEVNAPHCVTLRSSVIGIELARNTSLVEWFLRQKGTIKGFRKAIYSGLTTQEMSRVTESILLNYPELSGVWHVASMPINKYELLMTISKKLERNDIDIVPDDTFVCDRSLIGDAFLSKTGYSIPDWEIMLTELVGQIKQRSVSYNIEETICHI